MVLPAGDDVVGIERDGVELVLPVDAEFVPRLLDVFLVAVDAEVFEEKTALQREVRVPDLREAIVYHRSRLLVDEGNLAFRQKVSNLPLNAGSVFRPAA